jgi:DNA-binding IclR family transcriptional regulator
MVVAKIQSVEKAWDILLLLAKSGPLNLSEIADSIETPRATTFRILSTLTGIGLVDQIEDGKRYCIDYRVLQLSYYTLEGSILKKRANPYLYELADATKLIACLGVISGHVAVTIDKVSLHNPYSGLKEDIGVLVPAHVSSVGKAILAHLPQERVEEFLDGYSFDTYTSATITNKTEFFAELDRVQQAGYAFNDQEWKPGICSVAMPIFNYERKVIGAVAISRESHLHGEVKDPRETFTPELLLTLRDVANKISFSCGYHSMEMLQESSVWRR